MERTLLKGIQNTVKEHPGNLNEFISLGHARSNLGVLKALADTISEQLPAITKFNLRK